MVFVFSPYILKYSSYFQFQVSLTFNEFTAQYMSKMKSTKVLNPRRCIMRVYAREIRMRVHEKNGRLYAWPYNGGSAGSLQRSSFRENPTNILTFVAR